MSHEKWDDDKIEDFLHQAPKLQDSRSKEEVFKRLKEDGLFDEQPLSVESTKPQHRRKFLWIPITISIAALFILAIIVQSFISQLNDLENSTEQSAVMESAETKNQTESESADNAGTATEEQSIGIMATESNVLRTAVYPEDLEGNTLFTLGLASDAADSLPVTVLIPDEKIEQDFGKEKPTGVELYNRYAPLFNESAIGFAEYHPYQGEISEQGERVIHQLPDSQSYDNGSAALTTYFASLIDTFGHAYKEVAFETDEGTGFEFSEVGEPSRPLSLNSESTQYNYFKFTQSDGQTYLTPNFREAYNNVEEALDGMKDAKNDIYQSAVLPNVDFDVSVENSVAVVSFKTELDLETVDGMQAMQMIEGMLLTASSFNMSVQFENVKQTQWQGFDFTAALPMPVGANKIPYDSVFQ
ncbi:hypothetical protein D1B33_00740 [Lysinibacillus yapensis]|uniref:Uncharacterized protein n=1 Tax=Ureibacillus yapensis TaxID=2304605 RepID=A0A396SCM4_9BACL|nr:hypothetical protein [Lysinibacillus yapensis]RHW39403.1 hypothetical protein D1B33_00740 [Lysinibacillus yapensis]